MHILNVHHTERSGASLGSCAAVLIAGSPLTVATTGTWHIHPNVYNAVPRGASILLDIRDADFDRRQQVIDAVIQVSDSRRSRKIGVQAGDAACLCTSLESSTGSRGT